MYNDVVMTPSQAYCHLFFHCCLGNINARKEAAYSAAKFVDGRITSDINIDEQDMLYQSYKPLIEDESLFLRYLVDIIKPHDPIILYCYCVEIILSSGEAGNRENKLIHILADILAIPHTQQSNVLHLMEYRWKIAESYV